MNHQLCPNGKLCHWIWNMKVQFVFRGCVSVRQFSWKGVASVQCPVTLDPLRSWHVSENGHVSIIAGLVHWRHWIEAVPFLKHLICHTWKMFEGFNELWMRNECKSIGFLFVIFLPMNVLVTIQAKSYGQWNHMK